MSRPVTKVLEFNPEDYSDIIDVRSPSEFAEDHVPGAINLYVLNDEERKIVGTLYKQESPFKAKKVGAALISRNIAHWLETCLADKEKDYRPLVYCWRGGQRSMGMATILSRIDWDTHLIHGGYKHYRSQVREQLEHQGQQLKLVVVAGLTGTAKTVILKELQRRGEQVIDLEGLANHRGSLLGQEPGNPQPSQKYFESLLAQSIAHFDPDKITWIEAESNKIGRLHCPEALWKNMRQSPTVRIEAPLEQRVAHLLNEYHFFTQDPDLLKHKLSFLKALRGDALLQQWHTQIDNRDWHGFVSSMLSEHYDLSYTQSINRDQRSVVGTFDLGGNGETPVEDLAASLVPNLLETVLA
ncbi:MAG: tRNA 2-selenouridine(34) synthase MnmH [bacterium]